LLHRTLMVRHVVEVVFEGLLTREYKNMSTASNQTAVASAGPAGRRSNTSGDLWLYALLTLLTLGAWQVSKLNLFEAGDDVGYWLGVVGGVLMLALFSYPLRKYVKAMHNLGKVKSWFLVHMVLGISGPLLILVHSTFRIGSINAGVALYSMIIVALSGVVGRFIYVRVHRGLHGERSSLRELQARAGFAQSEARTRLHFAPAVEARMQAFEERELSAKAGWLTFSRQVFVLPIEQWRVYRTCAAELRGPLTAIAIQKGWSAEDLARREHKAQKLIASYLSSTVRVAQFTAYERFFSLWHVAHVPFVYIMVISAVFHVFAVHAY
jgi:hypothetical protein